MPLARRQKWKVEEGAKQVGVAGKQKVWFYRTKDKPLATSSSSWDQGNTPHRPNRGFQCFKTHTGWEVEGQTVKQLADVDARGRNVTVAS